MILKLAHLTFLFWWYGCADASPKLTMSAGKVPGILPEAANCCGVNVPGIRPNLAREPVGEEDFIRLDEVCESV